MDMKVAVKFLTEQELPQGSKEWLQWRQGGIGASEVFILACYAEMLGFKKTPLVSLGDKPKWLETPRQLYRRKLGLVKGVEVNADMQRGHDLEGGIRDSFNSRYGVKCVPVCVEAFGCWRVSLDGFDRKRNMLLEIKAPRHRMKAVPAWYATQVAYQRAVLEKSGVTSIRSGLAAGYCNPETGEIVFDPFKVTGNAKFERWLLDLVDFFWDSYIVPKKEPDAVAGDVDVRMDKAFLTVASAFLTASKALKKAKVSEEKARNDLLKEAGDFPATLVGGGVRLTQVPKAGSVDYKKLLAEKLPDISDKEIDGYRKPGTKTVMVKADSVKSKQ